MRMRSLAATLLGFAASAGAAEPPKTVLISLDGATPRLIDAFIADGTLSQTRGIGLIRRLGVRALRNTTVTPSLTAPGHIAIATGSSAARNDVVANTYHLVASPFATTISGFGAPIGGYGLDHGGPFDPEPDTALPVWITLRAAGKRVVAATWPGADGVDVRVPGVPSSPIVQPSRERTVDYTVPFGEFGGASARAFALTSADFATAPPTTTAQLLAAGHPSFSPVRQATLETIAIPGGAYDLRVAALDTTDDGVVDYDELVVFDQAHGIQPGPFALPSTGPAYVRADGASAPFFFEGSSRNAGASFFVSLLAPDLSSVHLARFAVDDIPLLSTVPQVRADIADATSAVGFWADQADFRIPERLSAGFAALPDAEIEAMYRSEVRTFVDYQARLAVHAIERNPGADLVMTYIEQPDGSEHQYLLVDPRQASDPRDPTTIGAHQDPVKVARYAQHVREAYQAADDAVEKILDAVGFDADGRPRSDVIIVSDHGFAPFHTAVDLNALLAANGFDGAQVRAITSGPAANLYIRLQGREPNGTVSPADYLTLRQRLIDVLTAATDANPIYAPGGQRLFEVVHARPVPADPSDPSLGLGTDEIVGQDSGDVVALLPLGYNFDGVQSPTVIRQGDAPAPRPVLSVPNFYGAHGYDPAHVEMSAIFYAAGPHIAHGVIGEMREIDVAPTIAHLLRVAPAATVEGHALFNHPPTIAGNPPRVVRASTPYSGDVTASDADPGDRLSFFLAHAPGWLAIDPATGALSGVPSPADICVTAGVVVGVRDLAGATATLAPFDLQVLGPGQHPLNDDFADAFPLTGADGDTAGANLGATRERGESRHAGQRGGASVWWRWRAPRTGLYVVDTTGSDFDTLLAIYLGWRVDWLLPVAANDDVGRSRQSALVLFAIGGLDYRIAVDGWHADQGDIALHWRALATGLAATR